MSEGRLSWGNALKPLTSNRWGLLLLRIALGGLLIASGASKFHDQEAFRLALQAYGMLPESLGNLYAYVLPWAEVAIGCCLVLGVFLLFVSGLTIPLVISFTIANIYAMVQPIGAAADCSCLGSLVRLSHPVSLTIDFAMLFAAVLLLTGQHAASTMSVGRVVDAAKMLHLGNRVRTMLKMALVAIAILLVVSLIPIETALTREHVDEYLNDGIPVLLFFHHGSDDLRQERPTLTHIEERYSQVRVCTFEYDQALVEAKRLHLDVLPALFIITGKSASGSYVVAARFEGALDEAEVSRAIDDLLGA